ncbi:MAG TPA: PqqD family protein [Solirubrobacterales bacterium]|nr:PqqD family protein [Solirubrobacterales bacterium]
MGETRFRIDAENVVHETVDGEVIAIDLGNGNYYSLAGSAPAIWDLLAGGATETEICGALAVKFEADAGTLRSEVSALLGKLAESGLVVTTEGATPERATTSEGGGNGAKAPFEPPRLERYTDMKDYFLLDPIHEVDTTGWPRPAA